MTGNELKNKVTSWHSALAFPKADYLVFQSVGKSFLVDVLTAAVDHSHE